jgi:1,4-dihydroxy-2-naphthoate octaprenyltransferase
MAEPDTLPPDPFAAESPRAQRLHRLMHHRKVSKLPAVAVLLMFGAALVFLGTMLLASFGLALIVLGALAIAGAVAAYRTLEDE